MAYDIGPKIGIDGEAEFRAQITKINTSIKTLGTEMQVVTSAFIGQEKSTEALNAQNNVLAKTVSALEEKLSQQKDMLAKCAKEYGETSEFTLKWQQAVNQTQTALNKVNAEIEKNNTQIEGNAKAVAESNSVQAKYQQQIKETNSKIQTLSTEMEAVTSAFIGQEKSAEALNAKNQVLAKTVSELDSKLELEKKMLDDATATYGEADARTQQWQQAVNKTTAELNKANAEIEKNNAQIEANAKAVAENNSAQAKYQQQIKVTDSKIQTLGTEMEAVTSAFIGQEKSAEALNAKNQVLAKTVSELGSKLELQKKMLADATATYGEADSRTQQWQQAVNKTTAELNKANAQIDANEQALQDDGKAVVDTAEKHERAMSKIGAAAKAGLGAVTDALKGLATATTAAVGAATAAVGGLVKKSVAGYGEYEQLIGGVETLYSKSFEGVFENAFNAYKTAGLSANEYMETATGFAASLIQSLGGDTVKAAEMADLAITDMADNANKMGTSMESIQNAYQGFAKQNYTMLDNLKLGYGGTKEEMQRLLSDAEKLPSAMGREFDLSNYADIVEAIHLVQENMGITGTTAAEASQTIEGSVTAMKTAWENLVVGLAGENQDIEQLVTNLVDSATTALDNILPVVETVVANIGPALETISPTVMELIPSLIEAALPELVEGGAQLLGALVQGITASLPALAAAAEELISMLVSGIEDAFPVIAEQGPEVIANLTAGITEALPGILDTAGDIITRLIEGLTANLPAVVGSAASILGSLASGIGEQLPALIPAAVDMILTLANALTDPDNLVNMATSAVTLVVSLAEGLITAIPKLLVAIPVIIGNLLQAITSPDFIPQIFAAALQLIVSLVSGLMEAAPELFTAAGSLLNAIINGITAGFSAIKDIGSNIVRGIWEGIKSMGSWITDQVTGFFGGIVDGVKGFLGIHSPSTVFAGIGENMALGLGKGWAREIDGIRQDIENGVDFSGLQPEINAPAINMPGLTLGMERPNYQDLLAGVVNGMQTATAGNELPQSATIILQAGDGMTLARWILPDLRLAMRDDPETV